MKTQIFILLILPAAVTVSFFLHWLTIKHIPKPEDRLPLCRGAYIAFSFQLLLYSWVLFTLLMSKSPAFPVFIPLGMLFSFFGDYFNLQFPFMKRRCPEPVFLGILCFSAAQIFYILGFLEIIPLKELISGGSFYPLLAVLLIVPALLFRLRVYNKERPKTVMYGAFFYGFILGAMAATAISAALARGGYWSPVAAGALFFLLSDAIMGETTIHGKHPKQEYQVPWITYLIAQGLILFGSAALVL